MRYAFLQGKREQPLTRVSVRLENVRVLLALVALTPRKKLQRRHRRAVVALRRLRLAVTARTQLKVAALTVCLSSPLPPTLRLRSTRISVFPVAVKFVYLTFRI